MNSTLEASSNTSMPLFFLPLSNVDMCVYAINFMFSFPANCYIIWLIFTGAGNGVASEFFNLNLSVCEISFSCNCLLIMLSTVFHILKRLQTFLIGITVTGRSLFQCLMCVERYLAVVHPVTFQRYKPLRYRVICSAVVWMITFCSCLCCTIVISSYKFHTFIWFFSTQFSLFLSIQLFCLVAVLRALKQSGPGERRREEENHMKRRAFHLILIITVNMVILFVPLIFAGFFTIFTRVNTDRHRSLGFICFNLGGFVHPVLFLHRTGKLSCVCSS